MKYKNLIILIPIIFFALLTKAQSDDYPMSGEGKKNTVKLFWLPQKWPDNLEGFIIKRRVIKRRKNTDWKILSTPYIYPELSLAKDLKNVESNSKERERLKQKLNDYLKGNIEEVQLKENSKEYFINTFKENNASLKTLSFYFYKDYDIALLNGFAFVDRNIPKNDKYEYGLFLKLKNKKDSLVNSFIWEYGTSTILNFDMDVSYKAKRNKKRITVEWAFDADLYYGNREIAGFKIYRKEEGREYQQVNDDRFIVGRNKDNISKLKFTDKNLNDSVVYYYAAAPVSIFNSIGEFSEIKFDPRDVPGELKVPELKLANKESDFKGQGIKLKWDFNILDERFINGFYIGIPDGRFTDIDTLSGLISPESREYTIKNPELPDNNTYRYKLIVDVKDYQDLFSQVFTYYVIPRPPVPNGLRSEVVKESETKTYIKLNWDEKDSDDQLTQSYKLYETSVNSDDTILYYASHIGYITENEINFLVDYIGGDKYGFALSAVSSEGYESKKTEVVFQQVPNYEIGWIRIETIEANDNRITLTWEYDDYNDLAGFRIFQNGNKIADGETVGPDTRTWTSGELEPEKYSFQIQAYTIYGVESEISQKRSRRIE